MYMIGSIVFENVSNSPVYQSCGLRETAAGQDDCIYSDFGAGNPGEGS